MTAKDFNLIADIFKGLREDYINDGRAVEVLDDTAQEFAHRLADTNPRFDSERFLKACGVA